MNHEMTRGEVTQYHADNIAFGEKPEPSGGPLRRPCEDCGGLVDLSSPITVRLMEPGGEEVAHVMPEAEARDLLVSLEIPQPPVLCIAHEYQDITTARLPNGS